LSNSLIARVIGLAILVGFSTGELARAAPARQVVQRWKLGGGGGWDYLTFDSATHRLFVSRATRVEVVDTLSGQVVGNIADTLGVHGIALAPDLHRGFTSNGKADSITVFDLDTLKTIQEVKIPAHNPDAILYEPAGKRVFTFNGKSKDVTVLDATTLAVVATIPVPDKPEFAVDDHAGQIFVNIETEPGQMVVIDSRKLTVKATWPLAGCDSPSGLSMDRVHRRLFSVCDDRIMAVTNAENGSAVARVPIGEGPDAAAFDEKRSLVLSSNGEGTLTVVQEESPAQYRVVDTVKTQRGARTMALDPVSGKVYLVTADFAPAPAPTSEQPRPRPAPLPDTFTVLVVGTH
jgi:YVTN family beta-propeller protein